MDFGEEDTFTIVCLLTELLLNADYVGGGGGGGDINKLQAEGKLESI